MSTAHGPGTPPLSPSPPPEGVLLVDKSVGPTSMDVCGRVRSALRKGGGPKGVKVGHAGTLDPLASGLVIVLVGKATRLSEPAMRGAKEYLAEIDLAHESDSHDLETEPRPVAMLPIPESALRDALADFVGVIEQLPPGHSAMRVGGMRAYHFARRGEKPPIQPRPVRIDAIDVLGYHWPVVSLRIECGKGAYIRSLARDLGARLGAGGLLRSLRRTRVGACHVNHAVPFDGLPREMNAQHLAPAGVLGLPEAGVS